MRNKYCTFFIDNAAALFLENTDRRTYSNRDFKKIIQPLGQQFVRINHQIFDKEEYLTQTPDNFYMVLTGECEDDNELNFAINAIVKTRQTIPFAANRLDDHFAEMSATKNAPHKISSWDDDYAVERFHLQVNNLLIDEHLKFCKIYGEPKISRMSDNSIYMLLAKREKYHGVCADMARLSVYHINADANSEYIACIADFSDNKNIFPEITFMGMNNPNKFTVSNNHAFVLAFRKDNIPIKNKITWAEAVKYNAILVDPWFKITFKLSDPNALKYIYYSIRTVYSLANKKAKEIAEDAIKNLDATPDAAVDYSKILEINVDAVNLSKVKRLRSNKQRGEHIPQINRSQLFAATNAYQELHTQELKTKEKENPSTIWDQLEQQFDNLDLDMGLCCIQ